jgi:hypothetical protein
MKNTFSKNNFDTIIVLKNLISINCNTCIEMFSKWASGLFQEDTMWGFSNGILTSPERVAMTFPDLLL